MHPHPQQAWPKIPSWRNVRKNVVLSSLLYSLVFVFAHPSEYRTDGSSSWSVHKWEVQFRLYLHFSLSWKSQLQFGESLETLWAVESQSWFFFRLEIFKSIGLSLYFFGAQATKYVTKMLLKVIFDKKAFVKFKIGDNFKQKIDEYIQNNQKSIGKAISVDFKNLKKNSANQKSRYFSRCLWFPKIIPYPRVWILKSIENLLHGLWIFILCDFHLSTIATRVYYTQTFPHRMKEGNCRSINSLSLPHTKPCETRTQ
jgi:hypothetical protein